MLIKLINEPPVARSNNQDDTKLGRADIVKCAAVLVYVAKNFHEFNSCLSKQ